MSRAPGAYGTNTSDTSFRKTWDREDYARRAAEREDKEKKEAKARYEAKLAGKTYHRRASTPPDSRETKARDKRLNVADMVGKSVIVPAGSAVGKKGRGAGFYCSDCDMTFKDNLQLVEHLNSRLHLMKVGETGEVRRATVEEVRERLEWLKQKKLDEAEEAKTTLAERLELNREREEKEREERRKRRAEKRRKVKAEDDDDHVIKREDGDDGVISARTAIV